VRRALNSQIIWVAILIAVNIGIVYAVSYLVSSAQNVQFDNWYEQQEYGCGINIVIIAFVFVSAITCVVAFFIPTGE